MPFSVVMELDSVYSKPVEGSVRMVVLLPYLWGHDALRLRNLRQEG
jgi:hypothetical protein